MATIQISETVNQIKVYTEGLPGPIGPSGSSAYDIWISEGNSGSQADFLNSLIGSGGSGSASIPSGTISGSTQVIYSQITGIPSNLFSASQQVNFSQISGSFSTSSFLQNSYSSSNDLKVQRLELVTSSFLRNSQTSSFVNNTYTSSNNLRVQRLEDVSSSFAIKTEISGAFNSTSISLSNRIDFFEVKTLFSGSSQVNYNQISNIPIGILSSSNGYISGSEQLTASLDLRYERKGTGILSSSNGFYSSSMQVDYNLIQNQPALISSASYALTASYVSGSNSISSSYALTASFVVGYISNSQTASMSVLSASYAPSISSSYASTSSYFNGIVQTASFATNIQTIGLRIKTDDAFIIEGSKGFKHIGYNSNIIKLRSIANIAGNINLNIKRDGNLLGNYQLSNQSSSLDIELTGWTSSLNTNDLIEFYVSQSSTYITDITFFMDLQNR